MDPIVALSLLFGGIRPPPARFDHSYSGTLIVRVLPESELRQECGPRARGCADRRSGKCVVYMIQDTPERYALRLRHEIAHCNGWPAHHPL